MNVRRRGFSEGTRKKPLVGDDVEITVLDEKDREGNLIRILPRRNSLIRPAVANVDQVFVIFALEDPKPNFMLLDRFLIMMEREGIPTVICFNKKDLAVEGDVECLYRTYLGCGYQVIFSSAAKGEGVQEIREILAGKTTVVAGPSGVGKSSLTNLLQGGCADGDRRNQQKTEARAPYDAPLTGNSGGREHLSGRYTGIFLPCI